MNQLMRVCTPQAERNLTEHANHSLRAQRAFATQNGAQLLTDEKLHHEHESITQRLKVRHLHDVTVRQQPAHLVFALEALDAHVLDTRGGVEYLQRNVPLGLLVEPFVNSTHAPISDHTGNEVPPADQLTHQGSDASPGRGARVTETSSCPSA